MMIRIECRGLVVDRLVALLALLGVHRSVEVARPQWRVLSTWGDEGIAVLEVDGAETETDIWSAVVEGIRSHHEVLSPLDRDAPDFPLSVWRAQAAVSGAADGSLAKQIWAALGTDSATRLWKDHPGIEVTPYCLMFGQGHQHFLKSLRLATDLAASGWEERLAAVLKERWRYDEPGLSFRWDPADDRRYALRAKNPSSDKSQGIDSANRLAAVGSLALGVLPSDRGAAAPGFTRRGRQAVFAWPVWDVPLGLTAIRALLRHPYVLQGRGRRPAGVREVRVAERRSAGKFLVVTPGAVVGEDR